MSPDLKAMSVYVVEDDMAVLESLCALLSAYGYETEPCTSAEHFLEKFDPSKIACIILDLRLPGMSGMELQAHLNETTVNTPIIMVTAHGDVSIAVRAMRAGAIDFIEKPTEVDQMLEALRSAELSLLDKPPSTLPRQVITDRLSKLTDREHEVLEHLLQGKLNKEIAEELSISQRTVEVHRSRIREKMQARGIVDLIRMTG